MWNREANPAFIAAEGQLAKEALMKTIMKAAAGAFLAGGVIAATAAPADAAVRRRGLTWPGFLSGALLRAAPLLCLRSLCLSAARLLWPSLLPLLGAGLAWLASGSALPSLVVFWVRGICSRTQARLTGQAWTPQFKRNTPSTAFHSDGRTS
jgi:hypothetical protein